MKDNLLLDWGYRESKDEDIDLEIKKKFDKDYPDDNVWFEDSKKAMLSVLAEAGDYKTGNRLANIRIY